MLKITEKKSPKGMVELKAYALAKEIVKEEKDNPNFGTYDFVSAFNRCISSLSTGNNTKSEHIFKAVYGTKKLATVDRNGYCRLIIETEC